MHHVPRDYPWLEREQCVLPMKGRLMIPSWLHFRWLYPFVLTSLSICVSAQTNAGGSGQGSTAPEGWDTSGYTMHQSMEFGYRGSDVTGSQAMYDSLVNLRSG